MNSQDSIIAKILSFFSTFDLHGQFKLFLTVSGAIRPKNASGQLPTQLNSYRPMP